MIWAAIKRRDTSFVMRKSFTTLPDDIWQLIANMISTTTENRESDSLQRAIELFRQHIQNKHHKTFKDKGPARKWKDRDRKERVAYRQKAMPSTSEKQYKSPISTLMGFFIRTVVADFLYNISLFLMNRKRSTRAYQKFIIYRLIRL